MKQKIFELLDHRPTVTELLERVKKGEINIFKYGHFYITRRCFRKCSYCAATLKPFNEKPASFWLDVIKFVKEKGNKFIIIIGNDLFVYHDWRALVKGINQFRTELDWDIAIYSTMVRKDIIEEAISLGWLTFSSGIDVTPNYVKYLPQWLVGRDEVKKSVELYNLYKYIKHRYKDMVSVHATMTLSRYNLPYSVGIFEDLIKVVDRVGFNIVHVDRGYQFASKEASNVAIPDTDETSKYISDLYTVAKKYPSKVLYLEYLLPLMVRKYRTIAIEQRWLCDIPVVAIDEDGSMMVCGYLTVKDKIYIDDIMNGKISVEEYYKWWLENWSKCWGCYWLCPLIASLDDRAYNYKNIEYWVSREKLV